MASPTKPVHKSRTTRNVAASTTFVTAGHIVAAIALLKSFGVELPGDAGLWIAGGAGVSLVAGVLNSLLTRTMAAWQGRASLWALVLCGALIGAPGCVTTTLPDGTVIQEADHELIAEYTQLALELYREQQARDAAEDEAEREQREERIAAIRDNMDVILEALRELREAE